MVGIDKGLDNKGVTLIEVITSMTLLFIILPVLLTFFYSGTRSSNTSYNINEIQNQGQSIMDFISDRFMTSSSVVMIKDYKGRPIYTSDCEEELGELKLQDSLLQEEMHIFSIQNDPKVEGRSIRYGNNNIAKIEAGNYIKAIYVRPLPDGKTYEHARGLKFTIIMEKGRKEISIIRDIYFRN